MAEKIFSVEVGGTFTDWVVVEDGGVVATGKVPSTPTEPAVGVMRAASEALDNLGSVTSVIHGSTGATNAVLERKGAVTAVLTTQGFRDVLQIQRQSKTRLFDLFYRQPEPLVPRDRVIEVHERIGPRGEVWHQLELTGLSDRVRELITESGLESVAICLLHSYANADHERKLARFLEDHFPDLQLTLSSEVLPRFREYERVSTCTIGAYLKPRVARYIADLERSLQQARFGGKLSIVQANGGIIPATDAREHAAKMILSGPAAGVIGATAAAKASGFDNLLTFDMGGTSTDVCLITAGEAEMTSEYKIGGLPLGLPMIDIVTVGAGGGSIATVDVGGALRVGPESAGAEPGPACYGKGGQHFTVTDANAILGLLEPTTFYGGRMPLSIEAATSALESISDPLDMSGEQVAEGIVRLANATMAQAMRLVSVERGHDPRDYTIVAIGGAGPLHAAALAEELSIQRVLIPLNPGLMSAYGLLLADVRQDYMHSYILELSRLDPQTFQQSFEALRKKAKQEFSRYELPWASVVPNHALDMRFAGQAYELTIPVDDLFGRDFQATELIDRFKDAHRNRYGHAPAGGRVEIVNFRLTVRHPRGDRHLHVRQEQGSGDIQYREREILVAGTPTLCRFYLRSSLPAGHTLPGPAIVEEPTSTSYVPSGWQAQVDDQLNLVLDLERS
jgi:N-methylhydantoinase A